MKANHLAALLVAILLSACTKPLAPLPPAPPPKPIIVAPAPLPPPAPVADWRDVPITPGEWSWRMEGTQSVARFGPAGSAPLLTLTCDRAGARVLISRAGTGEGHVPMAVTTTTGTRPLVSEPALASPGLIVAWVRSTDLILDAMAFSRGRFALDVAGLPPLYVPSWPEVSRVVEDCR